MNGVSKLNTEATNVVIMKNIQIDVSKVKLTQKVLGRKSIIYEYN